MCTQRRFVEIELIELGRQRGQLINTIFQKDIGYSKTSPMHFVMKACLNTRRRERVLGTPLNFHPVFLPRSMKLDPGQPPIPASLPVAMDTDGTTCLLGSSVPSCLQRTDLSIYSRNPRSTIQVCFFHPFVNCIAGSTEEVGLRATGFYRM